MSTALRHPSRFSIEDYLRFEETATERHEFVDGVLYAMVGGSDRHNLIAGNLFAALHAHLPDRCQAFEQGMKLRIDTERATAFYYPDVFVSCSPDDRAEFFREKPIFIAEVLSTTTERTDRGEKFEAYKSIPELQEYVLIAQDVPQVEVFCRQNAWRPEVLFREDVLRLDSVGLELPVTQLFRRITF